MDDVNAAFTAYREIKRRIVNLQYGIGEKLSEARLVADLEMGRSPIRSALARLKSEGWIAVSPQSGTYVRALTNRDIEQVTELRVVLEMHATGAATARITGEALRTLRAAFQTLGPRIETGDKEAFIELDTKFHSTIYQAAGNELIFRILSDLWDKVQWIRRACSVSQERIHDGFAELEHILAAMEARDANAAAERMQSHILNAAAFLRMIEDDRKTRERLEPAAAPEMRSA